MLFTTATEWIALALTLLGGWLLGLASHSGGRKWRDRYATERDAHAAARRDAEAKLTASEVRLRELESERGRLAQTEARLAELEGERSALEHDRAALTQANTRIAELERDNVRLAEMHRAASVTPAAAQLHPTTATASTSQPAMPLTRRVIGERPKRDWFDWGPGSDPRARRGI